jgi:hypothetical protein
MSRCDNGHAVIASAQREAIQAESPHWIASSGHSRPKDGVASLAFGLLAMTKSHSARGQVWLRLASQSRKNSAARATLLALAGVALAGCDIHSSYYGDMNRPYVERREAMTPGAGDAVASNKVLQMQDPWPAVSADRNLTTHGHVAAGAIERYRTHKVIQPVGMSTSSTNYQQSQTSQGPASTLSAVPTTTSAAAKP